MISELHCPGYGRQVRLSSIGVMVNSGDRCETAVALKPLGGWMTEKNVDSWSMKNDSK